MINRVTSILPRGADAHRAIAVGYILLLALLVFAVNASWPPAMRHLILFPVWVLAPGHILITLLSRRMSRHLPRCLVLAAAMSPLIIFAWLCLVTTVFGLALDHGVVVGASLLAALSVFTILRNPRHDGSGEAVFDVKVIGVLAFCVVVASLPLLNPVRQLSAHGLWDGAIIMQILSGSIPPDNAALAGHPTTFYWGYHLYLAAWTLITGVSFIEVSALSRIVSLITYISLSYLIAGRFLTPNKAFLAAFFIGFSLNCHAGIVFVARLLAGTPIPAFFDHFWIIVTSSPGMEPWLASIFATFMSGGAGSHGRLYWVLLIYACVANGRDLRPHYPLLGIALLGQLLFHHAMAFASLIAVPFALGLSIVLGKTDESIGVFREMAKASASVAIPLALAGPYLWSIVSEFGAYQVIFFSLSLRDLSNALVPHAVSLVLFVPFFVYFRRTRQHVLLTALIAVLLSAGLFVDVFELKPKFIIPLALPLAIAACIGVEELSSRIPRIKAKTTITILSGLAYSSILVWGIGWWMGDRNWVHSPPNPTGEDALSVHQTIVAADGMSVTFERLPTLMEQMRWIRDNTEPSAVIVERLSYYDRSLVGAVARRRAFVLEAEKLNAGLAEAERRFALVEDLFSTGTDKSAIVPRLALAVDSPIYLSLSADRNETDFQALLIEFRYLSSLTEVYHRVGSAVFKLRR